MQKLLTVTNFKWLGTAFFILAGLMLSLNLDCSKYGFLLFFTGHILFTWVFYYKRDWPMLYQNLFFVAIDLLGIYRWFF